MQTITFSINPKGSISLNSLVTRHQRKMAPMAAHRATGFSRALGAPVLASDAVQEVDLIDTLIETNDAHDFADKFQPQGGEDVEAITDTVVSAKISTRRAADLLGRDDIHRIQTKKKSQLRLQYVGGDIRLVAAGGAPRNVNQTGKDVYVAIIDSGFDLSHPAFRDGHGNLRVEALLDQQTNQQFNAAQLAAGWPLPVPPNFVRANAPGSDQNGHGTHVASIAAGSTFGNGASQGVCQGIACDSKLLLVRTDFINTDKALKWVFQTAGKSPCVVNMSLGHHFGAHDGTDAEEQLHDQLSGPGKIIVVAAGNEREDRIHLGGKMVVGQSETIGVRILRQPDNSAPSAVITLWYSKDDDFDIELITPTGQVLVVPGINFSNMQSAGIVDLELGRRYYSPSNLIEVEIIISFNSALVSHQSLKSWKLRLTCKKATVGRIDAWVNNSGYAEFDQHSFIEQSRTVGLPATGRRCISVASHISKVAWDTDAGIQTDALLTTGASSAFSSRGPTRDDRQKPDISAPGQYVSAALAVDSELSALNARVGSAYGLVSIEGTSMAAPVVAGVIALMLEKNPALTPEDVRDILTDSARKDSHTGQLTWNPTYGAGKIDVEEALKKVP